jgi:predicted phage-related endonuclease
MEGIIDITKIDLVKAMQEGYALSRMQTHDLSQGSQQWHEYRRPPRRNASDTPKVTGHHPTVSRTEFMGEWVHGIKKEFSTYVQDKILNGGHRDEVLARPLMVEIVGEPLSATVGSYGLWSASFDGINFDETICVEHKSINNLLRACKTAADLPIYHREQMEHQLMVCGGEKCLFLATGWNDDGTLAEKIHFWYEPDMVLRTQIVAAWDQFLKDAETYTPPEMAEKPIPTAVMALPALQVQIKGEVTASNMPAFVSAADAFLGRIKTVLTDDQDFADADANIKACDTAEKGIDQAKAAITAQAADIDTIMRTMDLYKTKLRDVRLKLTKLVTTEKEARKADIVREAVRTYAAHVGDLEDEVKPIQLMKLITMPDFAGATKSKRTITSIKEAVNNTLVNSKIDADALAKETRLRLAWFKEAAKGYEFLFPDLQQIIFI